MQLRLLQPWLMPPHSPSLVRHMPESQVPVEPPHGEPAATHRPLMQQPMPAQVRSRQQGSPGAPQASQVPSMAQLSLVHAVPAPVQKGVPYPVTQHGWPWPPQSPQPPTASDEQMPVTDELQGIPLGAQRSDAQQPSSSQASPAQHGSAGPPHA